MWWAAGLQSNVTQVALQIYHKQTKYVTKLTAQIKATQYNSPKRGRALADVGRRPHWCDVRATSAHFASRRAHPLVTTATSCCDFDFVAVVDSHARDFELVAHRGFYLTQVQFLSSYVVCLHLTIQQKRVHLFTPTQSLCGKTRTVATFEISCCDFDIVIVGFQHRNM